LEQFDLRNVTLGAQRREYDRSVVRVFATPSASGWALAGVASVGASGAMIMAQPPAHYGFVQEVAHAQDIHAGPIDVFGAALLAATLAGIGIVRYRDAFRFSRSLDGSKLDPPDP
jgi:hypothetical protein